MYGRISEKDPDHQAEQIRHELEALAQRIRQAIAPIEEPKAQALFETTAETLTGLATAYRHYGEKSEPAWMRAEESEEEPGAATDGTPD